MPKFVKAILQTEEVGCLKIPSNNSSDVTSGDNQMFRLRDVEGKSWAVKMMHVDGELFFTEGWRYFFEDHALTQGSLLSFERTGTNEYLVRVFREDASEVKQFVYNVRPQPGAST